MTGSYHREFRKYRYKHNYNDVKYKINLYYDTTFILPSKFSLIFTEYGVLFKKHRKVFFSLPYENLLKWNINNGCFTIVWNCDNLDDLYKKNRMHYFFQNNSNAILSIKCRDYHAIDLENTLNYFIQELMNKPEYSYLFS